MLMQENTAGCSRLLDKQLVYCERALGAAHPLAAKMLAVMARLQQKLGNDARWVSYKYSRATSHGKCILACTALVTWLSPLPGATSCSGAC
jgi:hypothetical protein